MTQSTQEFEKSIQSFSLASHFHLSLSASFSYPTSGSKNSPHHPIIPINSYGVFFFELAMTILPPRRLFFYSLSLTAAAGRCPLREWSAGQRDVFEIYAGFHRRAVLRVSTPFFFLYLFFFSFFLYSFSRVSRNRKGMKICVID